jgi:hypothetical protein
LRSSSESSGPSILISPLVLQVRCAGEVNEFSVRVAESLGADSRVGDPVWIAATVGWVAERYEGLVC